MHGGAFSTASMGPVAAVRARMPCPTGTRRSDPDAGIPTCPSSFSTRSMQKKKKENEMQRCGHALLRSFKGHPGPMACAGCGRGPERDGDGGIHVLPSRVSAKWSIEVSDAAIASSSRSRPPPPHETAYCNGELWTLPTARKVDLQNNISMASLRLPSLGRDLAGACGQIRILAKRRHSDARNAALSSSAIEPPAQLQRGDRGSGHKWHVGVSAHHHVDQLAWPLKARGELEH